MVLKFNLENTNPSNWNNNIPKWNIPLWTWKFWSNNIKNDININNQIQEVKAQTEWKSLNDMYSSLIANRPTNEEIQVSIWENTWLSNKIFWVRQQAQDIQRKMLWDQSQIFNATNPDWTSIDPRVKVAQYEANMKSYADRLDQLNSLENAYKSELSVLSQYEQQRITAEAEKTKTALQYMQQIQQQENIDRSFEENNRRFNIWQENIDRSFEENNRRFNIWQDRKDYRQDEKWNWYNANSNIAPDDQVNFSTPWWLLNAKEWTLIPWKYWISDTMKQKWTQCWEYVNNITGIWIWDTLQSKLNKMDKKQTDSYNSIINVKPWDVAVWIPDTTNKKYSKYWHAWIIMNEDPNNSNNWIIKSSNIKWDGKISIDSVPKILIMWTNSSWDKTRLDNWENEEQTELSNLWLFMKDNQETWVWYSNEDVKRFDKKIDRFVKNNDEQWMVIAYRKMLMRDNNFRKEFDNTQKFSRALDDIEKMINEYEKAWKSTNALKWFAEKIARNLWITTDEALVKLQTQMWFTLANYVKDISWTQASDNEVKRLMWNMAKIWNIKDLNIALINQAKKNTISSIKSMIDTRMYWMPEELKPKIFWDIYKEKDTTQKQNNNIPILKWRYQTQGQNTEEKWRYQVK